MKTKDKRRRQKAPAAQPPLGRAGAFTPDAISVRPRALEVGGEWVSSFAVVGYPREVHNGWLQPLLTYPGRVDVSLHIEPIDPVTAANRLKKQLSKLESGRRHTSEKGRLVDPHVEAATEDAYDLSARLARGEGKLYRLGLYLTVHAPTEEALGDEVAAIRSLAASLLLDCKPTTYRSLQGWITSLPMGLDLVGMRRTFDTSALSAAFPFTSPDLPPPDPTSVGAPSGALYGFNVGSQGLVHHDRFALDNHNSVILGRSGAGKSYLVKLELLRSLYRGIEIHVIDPEDEYARLAGPVSHQVLDHLAPAADADHLRAILVNHAVLAPRDERLIGLERAINRRIARVDDPAERRILRSYATWRHLRRLRTVADRHPITADQVVYACNALTAAASLLNWLHGRGRTLTTCTQDDIDNWLAIDAFSRSRGFVTWAVRCGYARNIEVPPFNNQPVREVFADHDQRWSLARQLLHDDSIALPDRVAGLLVLLYAQRAARITQLTTGNVTITDDGLELLLGQAPILVPEAFGDLLEALVSDRRATATGSQDQIWLYPAPRLGQPLAPRSLLQRLRALGVQATLGRNTALMEMAGEMPAAVITKLLGISLHRATRWTQDAGNTRPGYATQVARRGTP